METNQALGYDVNDANAEPEHALEDEADEDAPTTSVPLPSVDPERKTGVVYLSTVPPRYTASKIRSVFSNFGEVGRLFMQADKRSRGKSRNYVEGWVEFKRKSVAKMVAERLNTQQVGGKRRHPAYETLWSLKYLHGFKWSNLIEQLSGERRVEEQRMRVEITQARRQARHFVDQVEKSERLENAEKKVVREGGEWKRQEKRKTKQQATSADKAAKPKRPKALDAAEKVNLMHLLFDKSAKSS